jgi:hypothetical protein
MGRIKPGQIYEERERERERRVRKG